MLWYFLNEIKIFNKVERLESKALIEIKDFNKIKLKDLIEVFFLILEGAQAHGKNDI